jgi:hypothetical protein
VHLAFGRIATEDEAVASFLARLGLSQYASAFETNDIDLDTIAILSDEDLRDVGRICLHDTCCPVRLRPAILLLCMPLDR